MIYRAFNYDPVRGLADTNPNWYTYEGSAAENMANYFEIINWLYESIPNCNKHVVWGTGYGRTMMFKFRYEKNYLHFMLRWS